MPPPDQTKLKKPKVNVDDKMLDIFAEKIKKREEDEDDEEGFLFVYFLGIGLLILTLDF